METTNTRQSRALQQLASDLTAGEHKVVLDLGVFSQENVTFISSFGHRLQLQDLLREIGEAFGTDSYDRHDNPELARRFLNDSLGFPKNQFDAILLWDVIEFMGPALQAQVLGKIKEILKPGGTVLAMFHAVEFQDAVPIFSYRMINPATLRLEPRYERRPATLYNTRGIEQVFEGFRNLKFFLSRDGIREVIAHL